MLKQTMGVDARVRALAATAGPLPFTRLRVPSARLLMPVMAAMLVLLTGCDRLKPKPASHYVYVTFKATFLRDRIAAVSNRTGNVVNGQRLEILEQNRRFYKVRTDDGAIGWIDEHAVATEKVETVFDELRTGHLREVPVGIGKAADEVYLHDAPGLKTERLYLLPEGEKVAMLERASTPKPPSASNPAVGLGKDGKPDPSVPAPPPLMDDWWLVRDGHDHTGWMLSRMIDSDPPESIARYAEGQKIVASYVMNTVTDPTVEGASQEVPQYVVALRPPQFGLPYDFNQIRVFSWNLKKHRYETANRDKNILGYLPVKIGTDPGMAAHDRVQATAPAPSYTYTVLAAGAPIPVLDPATGRFVPGKGQLVTKTYRLEGNLTRRVLQPGTSAPAEARLEPEEAKKDKKARKRR